METTPQAKSVQQRLGVYREEFEQVKARLQKVGFILRGSIIRRQLPCGNQNCRCTNPKHWHGPYYQISWKQNGKTVSRILAERIVPLYRQWIANARNLSAIVNQMQRISRQAADSIQIEERTRNKTQKTRKKPI